MSTAGTAETEYGTGRTLSDVSKEFLHAQYPSAASLVDDWVLVMTHAEIQLAVRLLAAEINARFKDEKIVICAILKGAYLMLSDLTKRLTIPYHTYFVEASSYGNSQKQNEGGVELLSRLVPEKFHDRKVVLIDELYDHGTTMKSIKDFLVRDPECRLKDEDVFTVTVFSKDTPTDLPPPDLVGIKELPQLWLVGYGLDDQGEKRGWGHLFACPKIEGVPRVEADDSFVPNEQGAAAYRKMRKVITDQLVGIKARLAELGENPSSYITLG
jgi:hypoxanthine phosphoribosyltransferase